MQRGGEEREITGEERNGSKISKSVHTAHRTAQLPVIHLHVLMYLHDSLVRNTSQVNQIQIGHFGNTTAAFISE